jgi:alpha-beta hydrolase superfamily lysophospholipase
MKLESKELPVASDDITLGCSYIAGEAPRGIVILLHGIPSVQPPAPDDLGYPGWAEEIAADGWLTAWADLRAVRRSPGYFSIDGWVRDALAVIGEVRRLEGADDLRLALVGSSAGGCVSAEAVRRGAEVDAIALLGAPAAWLFFAGDGPSGVRRITEEAGMALAPDVLDDPTAWAAEFETITTEDAIADVRIPTLIIHGTADDVVPVDHAHRIAERASKADVVILEGAPHILRHEPRAKKVLNEWLDRTLT